MAQAAAVVAAALRAIRIWVLRRDVFGFRCMQPCTARTSVRFTDANNEVAVDGRTNGKQHDGIAARAPSMMVSESCLERIPASRWAQ
jgi:hypothetical protein